MWEDVELWGCFGWFGLLVGETKKGEFKDTKEKKKNGWKVVQKRQMKKDQNQGRWFNPG